MGRGKGEASTGLGRAEDTEEECETSGGESRDNASDGLHTFAPLVLPVALALLLPLALSLSAFICAMAVEIAGPIEAGCFLCRRTANVFARIVNAPFASPTGTGER